MTAELAPTPLRPVADKPAARRNPKPAGPRPGRLTASARRRVQELGRGNVNAWRHGIFSLVQSAPDVATEAALIVAARPGLDLIQDRRLVEHLAITRVSRQRAILAMATEGLTAILTSYDARLSPLEERLERMVDERERRRLAERARGAADPLERYRSGDQP